MTQNSMQAFEFYRVANLVTVVISVQGKAPGAGNGGSVVMSRTFYMWLHLATYITIKSNNMAYIQHTLFLVNVGKYSHVKSTTFSGLQNVMTLKTTVVNCSCALCFLGFMYCQENTLTLQMSTRKFSKSFHM